MEIAITPQEIANDRLSAAHLAQAVQAVREDGYVVLANAVAPDHLDVVRERMEADSQILLNAQKWGGAGEVAGHLQQGPPPFAPYIFRDIVANPFAIQVSTALLGEGSFNRFYNGNANTPGSGTQPLHADTPHLWPDLTVAHPTHALVVNLTLIDATEETGATELWPGTHAVPMNGGRVSAEMEAARRAVVPPVRAIARKGSILLRDMRLWHRGVPNHSQVIRHMIAMVHQIRWMQKPAPLLFNTGCEEAFTSYPGFEHHTQFTDQPLEYLFTRMPVLAASKPAA
ncbi:MAG: phytanoyl-CoA dioxygenase family protein [Caldilineaceae bacterium]|nr:phytanoyl-CoA dioxygenase family protein [Caldilineaceae bacterium]